MKSDSRNRVPKFAPMVVSGPIVQTNPLVWDVPRMGFPCWFNRESFEGKLITPFYSTFALKEFVNSAPLSSPPRQIDLTEGWECLELRARANPWRPSGRLEKLVLKKHVESDPQGNKTFLHLTLKFHGDGEQVECVSAFKVRASKPLPPVVRDSKYKGPRMANDTRSAVSGKRK